MLEKICLNCNLAFKKPSNVGFEKWATRRYCSYKCRAAKLPPPRQGVITGKVCPECGKEFFVKGIDRRAKQILCSKNCRKGARHPNWKDGVTPVSQKIRRSEEYNTWRKAVYRRDSWTCRMCHVKQKHPVAHHLKCFHDYPELRFDVDNGMTLCRSCHKIVHSEIGAETRFKNKLTVA